MGIKFRPHVPRTFKSLQIEDEGHDSRWANHDVLPAPLEERNYTSKAFFGYWIAAGVNATAWSLGSSNLAAGLDAGGTIGGVLVGSFIAGIVAFLCGEPGVRYHVGFPMMSRATFGMYGSYFVIMLKCFVNFIFFGVQAYWGGLAAKVVLASIFPSFQHMANTLPESALITTTQLIGFIMYIVIFTPMMFIHPSRMQPILFASFFCVATTIFGIFIWAVASNHGAPVPAPSKAISSSERSFKILQAMSSVAGSWTGSSIRQSDWTRYAKTRRSPVLNQIFGAPLTITVCATLGVFATSAVENMYGKSIWNPISLLEFLLSDNYNAATRAGCFFAGLGFFISQIATNLVQNSVAAGMDLASMAPKWIDVARGSLIMCLIGYVINPWRFVNAPGTFITVLSSFGMFVSPLAGINVVDFWIVRRLKWKIPDLYVGNSSSIYWFTGGLNWRAFLAWTLTIWPSFPGFIAAITKQKMALGWTRTFQVTWIVGFMGGGFAYYIITLISPPPGNPYVTELIDGVVEGVPPHDARYENKSGASSAQAVDEEMGMKE